MIIIIGAGLSGLLTGYLLKKAGIPFKILEARHRIGGRINTIYGSNNTPIEMGATWFTSQHTHLIRLLENLEIDFFEQQIDDFVFYQPAANAPTQAVEIPNQSPSYRISGGTSNLINTLYGKLGKEDVLLNQPVKQITFLKSKVKVQAQDSFEGSRIIMAIPPKLWAKNILFSPQLPNELISIGEATHTWMEDSIKVALTYDQPFWEEEKLSGTLFSNVGPITEFYDHCNHERSKYALCGFMNSALKHLSAAERRKAVLNQIKAIFGAKSEAFADYQECIWNNETFTFEASEAPLHPHQNNGNPIFSKLFFDEKLLISGAESASTFPGYMEGAVFSAITVVEKIIKAQ
jgi:putrescine oxidase